MLVWGSLNYLIRAGRLRFIDFLLCTVIRLSLNLPTKREGIKAGTEWNGTEPEVIVAQYGRGHWICYGKLVLICSSNSRCGFILSAGCLSRLHGRYGTQDQLSVHQEYETF